MSDGFQRDDKNLRGDKRAVKMNSWDTLRVWWAPVLARGKLSVVLLPADFPGDRPEGAEPLVSKVRAVLSARFRGASKPCTLVVDRGAGFYNAGTGGITPRVQGRTRRPWPSSIHGRRRLPAAWLAVGDDAPRNGSFMDQAWPDLDFATQAVGGDAYRVRTPAEGGRGRYKRTPQSRGLVQGAAPARPGLARCPGW